MNYEGKFMRKIIAVMTLAMMPIITSCSNMATNEAISTANEVVDEQINNVSATPTPEASEISDIPTPETYENTDDFTSQSSEISTIAATPSRLTVYVNETQFTMSSFYVEGQYYFYLRDIAFVLNDTIARFCLSLHGPYSPIRFGSSGNYLSPFDALVHRGWQYNPVGTELRSLPEVEETAAHIAALVNDQLWLTGGFFANIEPIDAYAIDNRLYVDFWTMGQIFGFDTLWDASEKAFHIDTNEPSITTYGRQVAEEFIGQFLSLRYSVRWIHDENRFALVDPETDIEVDVALESFYYREDERAFAFRYFLYDLNNDGVPEIVVQWGRDESRWNAQTLYVYKDGAYEAVGEIHLHIFYRCQQGELFLYSGDLGKYTGNFGRFYSIEMTENDFQRELLFGEYWSQSEEEVLISGSMEEILREGVSLYNRPRFPKANHPHRTDEPLLPLRPFTMNDI